MNFVLTGHSGLIGSQLLKRLKSMGHRPVSLVDLRGNRAGTDRKDIRDMIDWDIFPSRTQPGASWMAWYRNRLATSTYRRGPRSIGKSCSASKASISIFLIRADTSGAVILWNLISNPQPYSSFQFQQPMHHTWPGFFLHILPSQS